VTEELTLHDIQFQLCEFDKYQVSKPPSTLNSKP